MSKSKFFVLSFALAFITIIIGYSNAVAQTNILKNGGFESGAMDPWTTYGDFVKAQVVAKDAIEGKYCLNLILSKKGTNFWDAGLQNANQTFVKGKKYTLSAYVKSPQKLQINFKPELAQDPWTGYGDKIFTTTDKWQEYYVTTPVMANDVKPACITFHIAFDVGEYYMDAVYFYEGDYVAGLISAVKPDDKTTTTWGQLKSR